MRLSAQLRSDKLKWAKVLCVGSFWDLLHESGNISRSEKISPHWRLRTVWDLVRNSPLWASTQWVVAAMSLNCNISVYVDSFSRILLHCNTAFCDSSLFCITEKNFIFEDSPYIYLDTSLALLDCLPLEQDIYLTADQLLWLSSAISLSSNLIKQKLKQYKTVPTSTQ